MSDDDDFVDYIMNLRRRAGGSTDDPVRGMRPEVEAAVRKMLVERVAAGRSMPLHPDVYERLARQAGLEDEAKKRAAARFAGAGTKIVDPMKLFQPGSSLYGAAEGLGINYIPGQ